MPFITCGSSRQVLILLSVSNNGNSQKQPTNQNYIKFSFFNNNWPLKRRHCDQLWYHYNTYNRKQYKDKIFNTFAQLFAETFTKHNINYTYFAIVYTSKSTTKNARKYTIYWNARNYVLRQLARNSNLSKADFQTF